MDACTGALVHNGTEKDSDSQPSQYGDMWKVTDNRVLTAGCQFPGSLVFLSVGFFSLVQRDGSLRP